MFSLCKYDEISPDMGYPSMKLSFEKNGYNGKKKILLYLKSGTVKGVSAGSAKDVFTGERIPGSKKFYTDGKFSWTSSIIYYVDKYNLKLPEEFVNSVIEKTSV